MRNSALAGAVLVVSLLGPPLAATARAGCPCPQFAALVLPRTGSSGVPANVQLTLYADRTGKAVDATGATFDVDAALKLDLRDAANTKIPGTTVRTTIAGITSMYRFDPDSKPLPAGAYKAYAPDTVGASHLVTEFQTSSGEDTGPPAFGGLTSIEATLDTYPSDSSCVQINPIHRTRVIAPAGSDDSTAPGDIRYELLFYRKGNAPPGTPLTVVIGGAGDIELLQSSAKCALVTFNTLIGGTEYCARAKAVDLAGNPAGGGNEICAKAEVRTVDADGNAVASKGGGCRVGGAEPEDGRNPTGPRVAQGGLAAVLGLLAGRRWRKRHRP